MNLPDFLTQDSFGDLRLAGHRIGLEDIVKLYNEGFSPEMLAGQFPTLALALIHKVIAYYLENQPEVDTYAANCRAEMKRQEKDAQKSAGLSELRQRLEAMRRADAR